jgi:hypothetical protein
MKAQKILLDGTQSYAQALEGMQQVMADGLNGEYEFALKKIPQTRTAQQRKALQLYCTIIAKQLNDSGNSVQITLAQAVDREWDMDAVKSLLWKPIQKIVINKESTADADRNEYTKVYDVLNRFLGEKFGVGCAFPSKSNE